MFASLNVVEKIGQIQITGNVIPTTWYKNITFANGKPHFVAITILAEIVYWYRPTIVRDEKTGQIIEVKKKFQADMLQRSYQAFAEKFGFSKRQAKEAIDFLVDEQLIRREFRTVRSFTGAIQNNVMFVEPIPEQIQKVTYDDRAQEENHVSQNTSSIVQGEDPFSTSSSVQKEETLTTNSTQPAVQEGEPVPFERKTNTKIKQETFTKHLNKENDHSAGAAKSCEIVRSSEKLPCNAEETPITFFEENGFGTVGNYLAEKITKWCHELSEEQVLQAMKRAVKYGVKNWAYVEAILRNWANKACKHTPVSRAERKINSGKKKQKRNAIRKEPIPEWLQNNGQVFHGQAESEHDFEKMKRELELRLQKYGYGKKEGIA